MTSPSKNTTPTLTVEEYRALSNGKTKKKHEVKADFIPSVNPVEIITMYGLNPETSMYVRGHVYSSKNSKQILFKNPREDQKTRWRFDGKPIIPFIGDSASVEAYRKATWFVYKDLAPMFQKRVKDLPRPLVLQFTFIRMDNQGFDFPNIVQLVLDMMVYYGWIEDDEIKFVLPIPPLPPKTTHFVSDKNAGVIITIL